MPTGDGYDVGDLLSPHVDANKITHAEAKRWAELAYVHGQWSRDAEIEKLRGAYRAALGAEAEAKERLVAVLDAYDKIAKAVDAMHKTDKRLHSALVEIKRECGQVCPEFETCDHAACRSSYTAWTIADKALSEERGMKS